MTVSTLLVLPGLAVAPGFRLRLDNSEVCSNV